MRRAGFGASYLHIMILSRFISPQSLVRCRVSKAMTSSAAPSFLGFHLALVQLGHIGSDKTKNLQHASEMIQRAASGDNGKHPKPDLIALPVSISQLLFAIKRGLMFSQECFNSPYGHIHFPKYAETVQFKPGQPYDIEKSSSESVKMLSKLAKENAVWLIGGKSPRFFEA